ncbi:P-loop containing nucleoside triphosphate hydrolase [Glarea lozoyensis ATCC 20868]|uniref:p-loop containing nucleoside triphosphate hydrolase n=1 Tax=Glarea lozoyensis (strain ATCC 20868 / MF5171) TaxID=1116229 RepID=S3DJD9_GLAL2|nr:P-loop containing nucleoside triphosphate hydrolase [Glarea lozoyensis ATCC 20868]EPE32156.1 P-loop containing nucleoside triphosphate hydrolase [Glarea lozoyensis ATCC 20868]
MWDCRRGIPDENYNLATRELTPTQRRELDMIVTEVPNGILLITGGPGFGKTTAVVALVNLHLLSGKLLYGLASANSAVDNFHERTLKGTAGTKRLQRVYTESHEIRWLEDLDASNFHSLPTLKEFPSDPQAIYRGSLSQTVLQIAGVIPTEEDWLLELRGEHPDLVAFLQTPVAQRDHVVDARQGRQTWYKNIFAAILGKVDMVFCTTTCSGERFLRDFNKKVKCHVFDEAASTGTRNINILERTRAKNGERINKLAPEAGLPMMERLYKDGWPRWNQHEQLRMPAGLFDVAAVTCYNSKQPWSYGEVNSLENDPSLFPQARLFEKWAKEKKAVNPVANRPATRVTPAPKFHVYPLLVDVQDTYAYKNVRGTSGGNTQTAHYVLTYMKDLVQKGIAKVSDFGVVTPYLEEVALYNEVKRTIPFFKYLKVTTACHCQ